MGLTIECRQMFLRRKKSGNNVYIQLVESYREGKKVRQRVLLTLGREDELAKTGSLESIARSASRHSKTVLALEAHARGEAPVVSTLRAGPALAFESLWEQAGCAEVLHGLLQERNFGFDVERAIFLTVLSRIFSPGSSDRATDKWRRDYRIRGVDGLELHHLYRAMAWLGEPLPDPQQAGRTPFAPRCIKDLIEEGLFERRQDRDSLALILIDTTSLFFYGEGGQTLGQRGYSRDHRPQCKQMMLALVVDETGTPVCCEMYPGNVVDVTVLVPIAERLERHFGLDKICLIADRGMISAGTIEAIEARGWFYILGCRMRNQREVTHDVLKRAGRYSVVTPPRTTSEDPEPLKVKEVDVEGRRYVVCLNEQRQFKDRLSREAIVASLQDKLKSGDKSLVGNSGYRRFLKRSGQKFELDQAAIKKDTRYDGKWVLRTNTDLPTATVALFYKLLWMVEDLFRSYKSVLRTRPVYHQNDATIRGHVFCSFLSLVLRKRLMDRLASAGKQFEWKEIVRDLESLTETDIEHEGKLFRLRNQVHASCDTVLKAVGVSLPPTTRQVDA